jgi:ribosomal protein L16 Arg81 hydroxylase
VPAVSGGWHIEELLPMACSFLQKLSLSTLVAPVADEEFRSRYWERQPLVVHRKDPDYYHGLFSLEDFDEAIIRSPDYVKLANAATNKNVSYKNQVTQGLEGVLSDMRAGGTIVLDQLHHREPKLGELCRVLAAELGHRFQVNLYLTPPSGKGFSPHWDNHDVFILQTVGSKCWNIEKQRRVFPAKNASMDDEGRELRGDLDSFVLEQGDLIYIPCGFVHAAECESEP